MKRPFFICCPATDEVHIQAPSSKPRKCKWCDSEVIVSPNMIAVAKREDHHYDVIFTCRTDDCIGKCTALADSMGHPLKPELGRDYYRRAYDEYPPS